jgi:hypothetical protein
LIFLKKVNPDVFRYINGDTFPLEYLKIALKINPESMQVIFNQTMELIEFTYSIHGPRSFKYMRNTPILAEFKQRVCWWLDPELSLETFTEKMKITKTKTKSEDNTCIVCKEDHSVLELSCNHGHKLCLGSLIDWYFKDGNLCKCLICSKDIIWSECFLLL